MSATSLTIYINGITAVAQRERRLLMVNARMPTVSRFNHNVAIPAHFPFVRFVRADLASLPPETQYFEHDYVVPSAIEGDGTSRVRAGVVILDHHQIVLPRQHSSKAMGLPPGMMGEITDLVDMSLLGGDKGEIADTYLTDDPGDDIGAFADLPGPVPNVILDPSGYKTRFRNAANYELGDKKVMGQLCVYGVREFSPITLRFIQYRKKPYDFSLQFRPDTRWIMIGLSSLEDLLQLSGRREPFPQPDHHFELVYRLAKEPVSDEEIYLPEPVPPDGAPPAGYGKELGYPRCKPPLFNVGEEE